MKGLELSQKFYETYGEEMLKEHFPEYEKRIAVGLAGEGSECFGYDDEISVDHDFGPSFCLWLTDEDYDAIGEQLQVCYEKLPREFEGMTFLAASAYGSGRRGVQRIGDFYEKLTGSRDGTYSWQDFLFVPEYSFAAAVNGKVFVDEAGIFTAIRRRIEHAMPEDVRLKKIAARAAGMAQAGQYNFTRCIKHGEKAAAQVALTEFVKQTVQMVFLLNKKYCPYYKWQFRAMKNLLILGYLEPQLERLLTEGNDEQQVRQKQTMIEEICADVILQLQTQNLSQGQWDYLEPHAFAVMDKIQDPQIKSLHVMQG